MKWARHVAGAWDRRGEYRILVETPDGKTRLGRWGDNIKMDL
jgi:hypothetical protein